MIRVIVICCKKEKTPEAEGRLENLKKLVIDIRNRNSLNEFLEEVSLLTDTLDDNKIASKNITYDFA